MLGQDVAVGLGRGGPGRQAHRPDPHVRYGRYEPPLDPSSLPDGPVLPVGDGGVVVASVPDSGAPPSADAPGGTLYRFLRLSEIAGAAYARGSCAGALHLVADYQGEPVYALSVRGGDDAASLVAPNRADAPPGAPVPEEIGYRELYGTIGDDELALVGRAIQVVDWDDTTRYCARCATPTEPSASECAKRCPACGLTQYPRLAPAMIVGVVRDGRLLLGQSPRFRGRFHSILAGFLEPGETAEECVRREVYEEVGISVRNIRYFASQPWPFPHSLMLGFTAEYESGELSPDPAEIIHADWYSPDEMPNVPGEVSISGRIINWFRKTYG
ncbi:MAG: NAD(+) diphosphatase [Spirochaetota bacterium]